MDREDKIKMNQEFSEKEGKKWNDAYPNELKFTKIKTDKKAGNVVFAHLKDKSVYCSGQTFYEYNNIWIHDKEMIKASLRVLVLGLPIFKEMGDGMIVPYAGNLSNTETLVKIIMDKTKVEKNDDAFKEISYFYDRKTLLCGWSFRFSK